MNNKGHLLRYMVCAVLVGSLLFAQKPVRIDEILTNEHSFRLDTTLSYSNIQSSTAFSASQTFQTQNGDFVDIPVYLGTSKNNQDYLNMDLTLRYGLSKDIELFVSLNGYSSNTKFTQLDRFAHKSDRGLNAISAGVTYQVKPEDDTPSLLLGLSTQIVEQTKINTKRYSNRFKSFRLFVTSFYTVDPVVFLLSASYSINKTKTFDAIKRDDADIVTVSPQVYFAVNPYTSLNWGVKYSYFGKTTVDGKPVANSGSNLSFVTGVSYEITSDMFVSANAEYLNTNEMSQNTFALTLSYKF